MKRNTSPRQRWKPQADRKTTTFYHTIRFICCCRKRVRNTEKRFLKNRQTGDNIVCRQSSFSGKALTPTQKVYSLLFKKGLDAFPYNTKVGRGLKVFTARPLALADVYQEGTYWLAFWKSKRSSMRDGKSLLFWFSPSRWRIGIRPEGEKERQLPEIDKRWSFLFSRHRPKRMSLLLFSARPTPLLRTVGHSSQNINKIWQYYMPDRAFMGHQGQIL